MLDLRIQLVDFLDQEIDLRYRARDLLIGTDAQRGDGSGKVGYGVRQRLELIQGAKPHRERAWIERRLTERGIDGVDPAAEGSAVARLAERRIELVHDRRLDVVTRRVAAGVKHFLVQIIVDDALDLAEGHARQLAARSQRLLLRVTAHVTGRVDVGDVIRREPQGCGVRQDRRQAAGKNAVKCHGAGLLPVERMGLDPCVQGECQEAADDKVLSAQASQPMAQGKIRKPLPLIGSSCRVQRTYRDPGEMLFYAWGGGSLGATRRRAAARSVVRDLLCVCRNHAGPPWTRSRKLWQFFLIRRRASSQPERRKPRAVRCSAYC